MAREGIFGDLLPVRYAVGLSSFVGITGLPGQMSAALQWISGGTLEIVHPGASIGWGQGWPVPSSVIYVFDCNGTFYLAATGATVVAAVMRGRSQGFEGASLGFFG